MTDLDNRMFYFGCLFAELNSIGFDQYAIYVLNYRQSDDLNIFIDFANTLAPKCEIALSGLTQFDQEATILAYNNPSLVKILYCMNEIVKMSKEQLVCLDRQGLPSGPKGRGKPNKQIKKLIKRLTKLLQQAMSQRRSN